MLDFLTIIDTNENFETWISRKYIPDELKSNLVRAKVLLVPIEKFRDQEALLLCPLACEVIDYLREKLPEDVKVDICVPDECIEELALYDHDIILGDFFIYSTVATLFFGIVSNFIYDKFIKQKKSEYQVQIIDNSVNKSSSPINIGTFEGKEYMSSPNIQLSVTVVDENSGRKSQKLEYKGPASEFSALIASTLKSINEDHNE